MIVIHEHDDTQYFDLTCQREVRSALVRRSDGQSPFVSITGWDRHRNRAAVYIIDVETAREAIDRLNLMIMANANGETADVAAQGSK